MAQGLRSKLETTVNADGDDELKKLISVSLRPDDPFAKRLLSTPVRTNNVLLKVTVPKRTGRKRRRGSSGPFLPFLPPHAIAPSSNALCDAHAYVDAPTIYRSLQDNASTYKVTLAGVVDETHRFRSKQSTANQVQYPWLTTQTCPTCSTRPLTTTPCSACATTYFPGNVRLPQSVPRHS